ncbi:alpha/beta hydrolase [Streptomyces sp. NPDC060232]|uniref:alpha/beta hydrolase n=1 Tax=Streptomyces sp. NPDC060232 TaxID=3347079 RepID=UPI00364FB9D1
MQIKTIDHEVKHASTLPVNEGEVVKLFVRERDGTKNPTQRRAVLMLHGRSVPVLPGADLGTGEYNWMLFLAKAGFDVFAMDLQGHGRSPRPSVMNEPCNTNAAQQAKLLLDGHPLAAPCTPSYAKHLGDSASDWAEVHSVVEYIKAERGVEKVALFGWSAAAVALGPYAIQYPENVSSLFLLAPVFRPDGPGSKPGTKWERPDALPPPPSLWTFPMNIAGREGFEDAWDKELGCGDEQREEGMVDTVWAAIMENDVVGRNWGPPVSGVPSGVLRFRNAFWWGWNKDGAKVDNVLGHKVPVLIVVGEHDKTVNSAPGTVPFLSVTELYKAIPGPKKMHFKVACAGHQIPWERVVKHVHHLSRKWLKHTEIDGHTKGTFAMDTDGDYTEQPL